MKKLTVCIAKTDVPNLNGRIYPRAEMERAILNLENPVTKNRVFGQVGMPNNGVNVQIDKISHVVGNLRVLSDGSVMADVVWLNTPAGGIAKRLYEKGASAWGFRTASIGSTRTVGDATEIYNFRILSINMVADGA